MDIVQEKMTVSVWISLIKVKLGSALLSMLLICIRKYLNAVLRYKFLILDTCHQDTLFMWARIWRSILIFQSQKGVCEQNNLGYTAVP